MDDEDEDDTDNHTFPWEERPEVLPAELAVIWRRYGTKSGLRFGTNHLLEQILGYEGLPLRSADNNLLTKFEAQGPTGRFDNSAKRQQHQILNSLRVQTTV